MKKIISVLVIIAVVIIMSFSLITEVAAGSGNFSGPSQVKKGSSFTVSFVIATTKAFGINAAYSFDTTKLTLNSITDHNGAPVEYANNSLFADISSNPVVNSGKILNFNFTASGDLDSVCEITLSGISITEGDDLQEVGLPNVSHRVTIISNDPVPSSSSQAPASSNSQPAAASSEPSKASSTKTTGKTTSSPSSTVTSSEAAFDESTVSQDMESSEPGKDKVSDVANENKEDSKANTKGSFIKWIIIFLCVVVLGGAISVLIYFKTKKSVR